MPLKNVIARIFFLGIFDVIALQFALLLGSRMSVFLGIGIAIFVLIVNIVFLSERLFPWRWVVPALAGMFLLVVYPIGYAVVVAFTNYGDGHLLTKEQVITQRTADMFSPPDAPTYDVYVFRSDAEDSFRFWLVDSQGQSFVYVPGEAEMQPVTDEDTNPRFGARDENGTPTSIDGYNRLPAGGALRFGQTLQEISIAAPPNEIRITKLGIQEVQASGGGDVVGEGGVRNTPDGAHQLAGEGHAFTMRARASRHG